MQENPKDEEIQPFRRHAVMEGHTHGRTFTLTTAVKHAHSYRHRICRRTCLVQNHATTYTYVHAGRTWTAISSSLELVAVLHENIGLKHVLLVHHHFSEKWHISSINLRLGNTTGTACTNLCAWS